MTLPKLTEQHRKFATVLLRGGELFCWGHVVPFLDDLAAYGMRTIRPCEIARVDDEDMPTFAAAYNRQFGGTNGYVGGAAGFRRWLKGLPPKAAKVSTWLSGTG